MFDPSFSQNLRSDWVKKHFVCWTRLTKIWWSTPLPSPGAWSLMGDLFIMFSDCFLLLLVYWVVEILMMSLEFGASVPSIYYHHSWTVPASYFVDHLIWFSCFNVVFWVDKQPIKSCIWVHILHIKLACDGWGSDQSWSVGVMNGMFFLTNFLVLHNTTCVSICKQ